MEFFIYLSKSAAILFLFYLVYIIVLRKDTFFTANRFYLLSGIIAALSLPLISYTQTVYIEIPALIPATYATFAPTEMVAENIASIPQSNPINWWYVATMIYLLGIVYMLGLFAFRLSSLVQLLRKYPSKRHNGFVFVQVADAMAPFSFFNYIVYNPQFHSQEELQMILQHEQVHAAQWHSLDVLAAHVLRAIHWLNPISWWYKKSLEANLEFIADDQTAQHVPSKEAYQLALVKASSALQTHVLTTNFYQSFIKKRIIMLNKDHSNKYNRLKLSLIVPVLGLFLWSFNTNEVVEYIKTASIEETTATAIGPLTFSAETSNSELDEIENYLAANHPESLVKIANRKRNTQGELVKFSFKTKFQGHNKYYTRFDRQNDKPFLNAYEILPQKDGSLVVNELGENGVQLLISKEVLKINSLVELGGDTIFYPETTPIGIQKAQNDLGDNPLYIINNKSYKQDELPEHSEIRLDGEMKSYSKEEGQKKYGVKGKDGVLLFDGVATFVKQASKEEEAKTKVTSQGTIVNIDPNTFTRANNQSIKRIQFPITKNTTDAKLDSYAAEAKQKYGYDLSFTVNRNSNQEITGLQIAYTGKGNSGNISSSNGGPIADSFFFIDNETGGAGFMNEGSEERMIEMREKMEVRKAEMQERREEMEIRRETQEGLRGKASERRRALLEEKKGQRRNLITDSIRGNAQLFEERREMLEERREEHRARLLERREEHEARRDSIRGSVYHYETEHEEEEENENHIRYIYNSNHAQNNNLNSNQNHVIVTGRASNLFTHSNHDESEHAIMLDKDTADATLAKMKSKLKKQGVDFNYKRVKRNSRGEITSIKLTIDNNRGSKITKFARGENGDHIEEILVRI